MPRYFDIRGTVSKISAAVIGTLTVVSVIVSGSFKLSQQPAGRVVITESSGAVTTTPDLTFTTTTKILQTGTSPTSTVISFAGVSSTGFTATRSDNGIGYGFSQLANSGLYYLSTNGALVMKYNGSNIMQWGSGVIAYVYTSFNPTNDNVFSLGGPAARWSSIYGVSVSSTNATSSRFFASSPGTSSAPAFTLGGSNTGLFASSTGYVSVSTSGRHTASFFSSATTNTVDYVDNDVGKFCQKARGADGVVYWITINAGSFVLSSSADCSI